MFTIIKTIKQTNWVHLIYLQTESDISYLLSLRKVNGSWNEWKENTFHFYSSRWLIMETKFILKKQLKESTFEDLNWDSIGTTTLVVLQIKDCSFNFLLRWCWGIINWCVHVDTYSPLPLFLFAVISSLKWWVHSFT